MCDHRVPPNHFKELIHENSDKIPIHFTSISYCYDEGHRKLMVFKRTLTFPRDVGN